jgi:hypothetical protein
VPSAVIIAKFDIGHIEKFHFMSFHVRTCLSCHFISFHVISCHFMLHHDISCVIGLFRPAFNKVWGRWVGQICLPGPSATPSLSGQRQKKVALVNCKLYLYRCKEHFSFKIWATTTNTFSGRKETQDDG